MTIAHVMTLLAFVGLGGAGLASIQAGLAIVWQCFRQRSGLTVFKKPAGAVRKMKIIY